MGSKNTKSSQSGRDVAESKRNDELKKHFIQNAIKFNKEYGQKDYATSLPIFLDKIVLPPNYPREKYDEHFPGVYATIKKFMRQLMNIAILMRHIHLFLLIIFQEIDFCVIMIFVIYLKGH